ncbi:hypothetical protein HB852_14060 [Listeria grandensis]|uniref:O-antigen ligase domain-containing protein n=1 Tax=Listeria grandensis TaxID=1494963 RepID=A0A7X0Y4E4_9LIST|nr:O-antigen ligase family protein [Listeria grandensis]MBC1475736.1 hypothetical protein [Listeria grandensis]MBC1936811.1 hypothetical protein [Listeria grandensis]
MKTIPVNIRLFIGLSAAFPLVDFINGFLLTSGILLPVGMVYRFFFFLFLISMILLGKIIKNSFTFITFGFIAGNLMLLLLQSIWLQNPLSWIIADLSVFVKYFLWALIPYYIYQRKADFQKIDYEKMFIVISLLFTVLLLIPYGLGVGYQTYDNSNAGYKGFFFANNDTSFAFIVSITFTAKSLVQQFQAKWGWRLLFFLMLYAGNMLCLLLVGTKTGIVYGAVVSVIVLLHLLFIAHYPSLLHKIFVWLMALFWLAWVALRGISYALQMVSGTYDRMTYFYRLYDGNLVRLLSSSRSDFFQGGLEYFLNSPHPTFTLLFGQGFEYRLEHFGRLGLIEMDVFDAFFGLGFLGVCLLGIMLGYYGAVAIKKANRSLYSYLFFLILLYSFFAGHVLFSALSSTFLGLICGGIILTKKE